jgi:hypothetical protein
MQAVDITLAEQPSTRITSLRVVQQKHCGSKYKLIVLLLQTKRAENEMLHKRISQVLSDYTTKGERCK